MEMQILRSQINPHFMFNTINALKSLTMQHKYEEVGYYFDEFSKLLRLFLENSRSKKITLEKELKALELYVIFENLRLRYKVKLDIDIDPQIDINFTEIPPTILQPFVENAIWHGLNPKESNDGKIEVKIKQQEDESLEISIIDNGVGRKVAAVYSAMSANHTSLATKIIEERLSLVNDSLVDNVKIIDLYDSSNHPIGTKVVLNVNVMS
jgi:sensor histidine kinase YesM